MKKNIFFTLLLLFLFVKPTDIELNVEEPILNEPLVDLTLKDFQEPETFDIDEISHIPQDYKKIEDEKNSTKEMIKTQSGKVKTFKKHVNNKIEKQRDREKYFKLSLSKKKNGSRDISICTTLPKTGTNSVIGKEILYGMNLAFNKINKKGGVKGSIIKLYFYDDESSFAFATKNIKKLKKKSPLFISLFGLNRMYAIEPYIKKGEAFDLFPIIGSSIVRDKYNKDIIYFRASEKKEIEKLIDYSVKKQNKKAISIFYERSESGQAAYEFAKKYLKNKYNLQLISVGSYSEYTVNVLNAIKEISQRIPSSILCLASARASYNFIRRAINKGLHHCLFLGLSRLNVARQTLSKARGVKVVTSSVVPSPEKSELLIAKQYRRDMKKYLPTKKLTRFSFEGYINAQILIQILKGLREPITTEKIFESIENLKKMKFRGLKLNFGVEPRTLSSSVWLEEN